MEDDGEFLLDDIWTMYYHRWNDSDWTYQSYKMLGNMSSAEEFWKMHSVTKRFLHMDMFFLFREHVFPCWDDPNNMSGGCVSVKIPNKSVLLYWEEVAALMLCEEMCEKGLNGISSSPKNNFCIIKLWFDYQLSESDVTDLRLPKGYVGAPLFRSNRDNIQQNNAIESKSSSCRDEGQELV